MATHQEVYKTCDMRTGSSVCGTKTNGETRTFSVNNRTFEIDLCDKHDEQFDNAFGKFVMAATEIASVKSINKAKVKKAIAGREGTFTTRDVREWLAKQGREAPAFGRLPNALIEEYQAAHR